MEPSLEIAVQSSDPDELSLIEAALRAEDLQFERLKPSRVVDPVTLIALAGGVVGLVNGVLALSDRLRSRNAAPIVVVRNEAGDELPVEGISRQELENLIGGIEA